MRKIPVRSPIGAALLLAVAFALYAGWWFHLAGRVRGEVERWAEARRAEGWEVAYESLEVVGFPFTLAARLEAPRILRPDGIAWSGPTLRGFLAPFRPDELRVLAPGRHEMRVSARSGNVVPVAVAAERAEGRFTLGRGGIGHGELRLGGARVTGPEFEVTVKAAQAEGRALADGLAFKAAFAGIELASGPSPVLGRHIAELSARGRLAGRLRGGPTALAAWRDDGGTVEFERLVVDWPPLRVVAEGTLALDEAMQPLAALSGEVSGLFETVDAAAAAGLVRPKDAGTAKLLLGLMARTPPGGGPPSLTVPITIQDRRLYVGPAAVARLPEVAW